MGVGRTALAVTLLCALMGQGRAYSLPVLITAGAAHHDSVWDRQHQGPVWAQSQPEHDQTQPYLPSRAVKRSQGTCLSCTRMQCPTQRLSQAKEINSNPIIAPTVRTVSWGYFSLRVCTCIWDCEGTLMLRAEGRSECTSPISPLCIWSLETVMLVVKGLTTCTQHDCSMQVGAC